MDKYLTSKADPKRMAARLESLAGVLLFALLIGVGIVAVHGFLEDGFMLVPHLLLLGAAAVLLALLKRITDAKRARIHARVIVRALCATEDGCVPYEELMKVTGVKNLEAVIGSLSDKGYIRQVAVRRGNVVLTDKAENN